jgi:ABC-type multidrug transport system ATPase subunit
VILQGAESTGKSTLAQIAAGFLSSSEGDITWKNHSDTILRDKLFAHVSMCTPLMQLWDDFTLAENFELFCRFKSTRKELSASAFAAIIGLENVKHRALKDFSSGMRQRVKLGMAILANTPLLILDEPCSHLDAGAIAWYQELLESNSDKRTILIASNNDPRELFICSQQIDITDYKPKV